MFVNFAAVIAALGADAAIRIANEARAPGDYLFETLLPEEQRWTYSISSGSMSIRPTMAGLVGMDSPYPPGGIIDVSTFVEQTAKIANEVPLSEQALREMQQMLMALTANNQPTNETAQREVLNFYDKVVVQPHLDAMEWLRGQALCFGSINWTYNRKDLVVSYGVPGANILATRTVAGNTYYGGSASAWWADIKALRKALRGNVRAILAHPDTVDMARFNNVNAMVPIAEGNGTITLRRTVNNGTAFSPDAADTVTIVLYDREGEIVDPANPTQSLIIPFMERGKLVAIGNPGRNGYRVGEGATDDPRYEGRLGYTHIAPTTENGGRPGRWGQLYTPENAPWSLRGRAVTNGLPVIETPEKIAIATTEMA